MSDSYELEQLRQNHEVWTRVSVIDGIVARMEQTPEIIQMRKDQAKAHAAETAAHAMVAQSLNAKPMLAVVPELSDERIDSQLVPTEAQATALNQQTAREGINSAYEKAA